MWPRFWDPESLWIVHLKGFLILGFLLVSLTLPVKPARLPPHSLLLTDVIIGAGYVAGDDVFLYLRPKEPQGHQHNMVVTQFEALWSHRLCAQLLHLRTPWRMRCLTRSCGYVLRSDRVFRRKRLQISPKKRYSPTSAICPAIHQTDLSLPLFFFVSLDIAGTQLTFPFGCVPLETRSFPTNRRVSLGSIPRFDPFLARRGVVWNLPTAPERH